MHKKRRKQHGQKQASGQSDSRWTRFIVSWSCSCSSYRGRSDTGRSCSSSASSGTSSVRSSWYCRKSSFIQLRHLEVGHDGSVVEWLHRAEILEDWCWVILLETAQNVHLREKITLIEWGLLTRDSFYPYLKIHQISAISNKSAFPSEGGVRILTTDYSPFRNPAFLKYFVSVENSNNSSRWRESTVATLSTFNCTPLKVSKARWIYK